MAMNKDCVFSAPPSTQIFHGILSDFDGTIIDSTDAIVKHWHEIGKELGVDPETILATSHGRRSIDVLKIYDASKANWDYVSYVEGQIPRKFGSDAVEIPGARDFLSSLDAQHIPWCVVTSGTEALVSGWLDVMKMARPAKMVVAEDVKIGKPDPACYLLGQTRIAEALGERAASKDMLILEDAPSGVRAGKAAGFKVLGLATTHDVKQLVEAGANWIVRDLRSLKVSGWDKETGEIKLEILDALKL